MRNLIALTILVLSSFSCQPAKEKEGELAESQSFEAERNAFHNYLEAPKEVAAQLQATAADFNPGLINSNAFSNYVTDDGKAASNLGIYLADLNYCIAFGAPDHVSTLFTASKELGATIGIERDVLDFLMKRFEANINQNDSVKAVVNDLFESSTSDLQGPERERLVGIAMSAYQIENLHLLLGTIKTYPRDILPDDARTAILIPLFRMVLEQKSNVETIYNFLKTISNPDENQNYIYYANAFEELIAVYQRLNVDEKIANNQGAEVLTDEVVMELSAKVDAIRSKAVSVE